MAYGQLCKCHRHDRICYAVRYHCKQRNCACGLYQPAAKAGVEKYEAIVEAGRTRLRPIVMTAPTTILGLLTMAIGLGMGAEMTQPMAIVTIGGLIYGTLFDPAGSTLHL